MPSKRKQTRGRVEVKVCFPVFKVIKKVKRNRDLAKIFPHLAVKPQPRGQRKLEKALDITVRDKRTFPTKIPDASVHEE